MARLCSDVRIDEYFKNTATKKIKNKMSLNVHVGLPLVPSKGIFCNLTTSGDVKYNKIRDSYNIMPSTFMVIFKMGQNLIFSYYTVKCHRPIHHRIRPIEQL